jgi:hypothetical protein
MISGVAVREKRTVSNFRGFACNPLETGDAKGVFEISDHETAGVEKTKTDESSKVCGTSRPRQGPHRLRPNLPSWAITGRGMCLPKRGIFDTMQNRE